MEDVMSTVKRVRLDFPDKATSDIRLEVDHLYFCLEGPHSGVGNIVAHKISSVITRFKMGN